MGELEDAFGELPADIPTRIWPRPPAETIIPQLVSLIVAHHHPLAVLLFGSRARGDHHHDSDVDLLVVMPPETDTRTARDALRMTTAYLPIAKDIVVTTPNDIARYGDIVGTVLQPALRDGIVLYDSRK